MRAAIFLLFVFCFATARAVEVKDLRCEDLVAPIGVDVVQPRLSWILEDPANARGQKQTAYQILVATGVAALATDNGDLWDSGKVTSEQSLRVPYNGTALASRQRAFWKVRVWDKDGNASAWSASSEWTMGLLNPSDWSAKWIAHSASSLDGAEWIWFNEGNPAVSAPVGTRRFRRTIALPADRVLTSARLRVTADNAFTLTINGTQATSGSDWTQPVSADITPLMQSGDNAIAINATNAGTQPGPAGLIARFDFTFASGEPLTVVTNNTWEASIDGNAWSPALSLGAYGIAPWGAVSSTTFPHPWMRRNFEVAGTVNRALVFVNTPGHFELYLNGSKVGDDVLAPVYSDFTKRMFVVAYDVTPLLQQGTNCLALWTAPGWYQPRYGNPYGSPIARAQLDIETSSGNQSIGTDASWRTRESSITQVGSWGWADMGGERWDDAKYIPDWNLASHNDTGWNAAREITPPAVLHVWPAMPPSRMLEPVAPVNISQINGKWVVDFGRNICGWVRLRMHGLTPGQQITLTYSDLISPPELMHIADGNGFQTFGQINRFLAGSSASAEYLTRFNQHSFRYAIIDGLANAPVPADIEALPVMTALEPAGTFESSNALFNKIHAITMATYRAQIPVGVLGGGETREKEGYGDAGAFLTGLLYNFRSDSYFRKWLDDWTDGQRADGFIQHTAPVHVNHGGGPPWGGQASELTRRLLLYHGDASPIPAVYNNLKRYVDYIETKTVGDILRYYSPYNDNGPWFLGDWVTPTASENEHGFPLDSMDEKEFFNNCYRVILWEQLAMLAGQMGDNTEAQRCRDRLAVLRPLIHAAFYDPAAGNYRANRQAFLTIALLARVMPEEMRPAILQKLVDNITVTRNGHLGTGLIGTSFMLDLLAREGRNDLVAMMMNKTTYPSWGFLSETRGCTTWPETWTGWGSQIILVTGTPGAWFHEGLIGLRPDAGAPGFKKFSVIPGVVKEADWARATHDSPFGKISIEWRKQTGNTMDLDVEVPPNTTAEIHVPATAATDVTESGNPASSAPGVSFLRMENGRAVFAVGAGSYQFTGVLPATLGPVVEVVAGSPLALDYSGSQTISALLLGGIPQPPGTYSAATHPEWFTGTGSLLVMPQSRTWDNGANTGKWNSSDANWSGQTWQSGASATIAHSAAASTISIEEPIAAAAVAIGNGGNNAAYTFLGPGSLATGSFTIQGEGGNTQTTMPVTTITDANINISGDLGLGRAGLVIGGDSVVSAKRLGGTGIGSISSADWGTLTLQDHARLSVADGILANTTAWGVNLNGGTLTTMGIRYGPHAYLGSLTGLFFNGTLVRANRDNPAFLGYSGGDYSPPVVQAGGARIDTNGHAITLGLGLTGPGVLTKSGAGILTLAESHAHAGGTVVEGGTLVVTGTMGSGDLTVSDGAVAELRNTTPAGAMADSAAVRLHGTGRLHLGGDVAETVAGLHIDGVQRMAGTWNATRDPARFSGTGNLIVSNGGAPTPAEAWRFQHFSSYNNSGDSANDADPDQDGSNNLLERALGTNPRAFDASGKPAVDPGTPGFSFTFTHSKSATDLDLFIEVSTELQSSTWEETLLAPAPDADGVLEIVDDTRPDVQVRRFTATTTATRKFYRLRARE